MTSKWLQTKPGKTTLALSIEIDRWNPKGLMTPKIHWRSSQPLPYSCHHTSQVIIWENISDECQSKDTTLDEKTKKILPWTKKQKRYYPGRKNYQESKSCDIEESSGSTQWRSCERSQLATVRTSHNGASPRNHPVDSSISNESDFMPSSWFFFFFCFCSTLGWAKSSNSHVDYQHFWDFEVSSSLSSGCFCFNGYFLCVWFITFEPEDVLTQSCLVLSNWGRAGFDPRWSATCYIVGPCKKAAFACLATDVQNKIPSFSPFVFFCNSGFYVESLWWSRGGEENFTRGKHFLILPEVKTF